MCVMEWGSLQVVLKANAEVTCCEVVKLGLNSFQHHSQKSTSQEPSQQNCFQHISGVTEP